MSIYTYFFKKNLLINTVLIFLTLSNNLYAAQMGKYAAPYSNFGFTPPPIPPVNTADFKTFVREHNTFPSPYGYMPYLDKDGHEISYLIKDLNHKDSYIPVSLYCNTLKGCPIGIVYWFNAIKILYPNKAEDVEFRFEGVNKTEPVFLGFYFPNDPKLYNFTNSINMHGFDPNLKKDEPFVTLLLSQNVLLKLSHITANNVNIDSPLADGNESLSVGTTLSIIGLGEASGVEFSETVSQTTGETYTSQVQTGFSINISMENQITLGGGDIPLSDSLKYGINQTLSTIVTNGVEIANLQTTTRTYTIKPGINDTYYWAIYQLLYSYRIHAPLLQKALKEVQTVWNNKIEFKIGDSQETQDKKLLGKLLRPVGPNHVSDVTVGVAVSMNPQAQPNHFYSGILKT